MLSFALRWDRLNQLYNVNLYCNNKVYWCNFFPSIITTLLLSEILPSDDSSSPHIVILVIVIGLIIQPEYLDSV